MEPNHENGFRFQNELIPEDVIRDAIAKRGGGAYAISVAGRALDAIIEDVRVSEGVRTILGTCRDYGITGQPTEKPPSDQAEEYLRFLNFLQRRAKKSLKKE